MNPQTREERVLADFTKSIPAYRIDQMQSGLFDVSVQSWDDITSLPTDLRNWLKENIPFASLTCVTLLQSEDGLTKKALLETVDGEKIETVLMKNSRGHCSVCVSSQVGCAMNCTFCATGKMGLTRNLTSDEIVDQYRFWQSIIGSSERISNIVFMGMGEPLVNYVEVKKAIADLLEYTDIGCTKIIISTVGILPRLNMLLLDPDWPSVRLAVSLHSASQEIRASIMPSTSPSFLIDLAVWAKAYLARFGNRKHHLTFEYLLMKGINDSIADAKRLAKYVQSIGNVKINLLIYNNTGVFEAPDEETVIAFGDVLRQTGIDVTRRRSMGNDIFAACGQLANKKT